MLQQFTTKSADNFGVEALSKDSQNQGGWSLAIIRVRTLIVFREEGENFMGEVGETVYANNDSLEIEFVNGSVIALTRKFEEIPINPLLSQCRFPTMEELYIYQARNVRY